MTYVSFTGYLRYAGGFSASLSSAIASLVGAPRVLQAVGVDKIYPGVFFFAKGGNANNDPWRGYIFCFVIAFGLCMIASLNEVSVIASKQAQVLTETPDHVKNYRPKVLLLSGNPAPRPPLVNFASLVT